MSIAKNTGVPPALRIATASAAASDSLGSMILSSCEHSPLTPDSRRSQMSRAFLLSPFTFTMRPSLLSTGQRPRYSAASSMVSNREMKPFAWASVTSVVTSSDG